MAIDAWCGERYAYHANINTGRGYAVSHIGTGIGIPSAHLNRDKAIALVQAFDGCGIDLDWPEVEIELGSPFWGVYPPQEKYDALGEVYRATMEAR